MDRYLTVQGVRVPAFLYGTAWKEQRTEALTRMAIDAGFRGIDTANQRKHYVEAAVGDAIASVLAEGKLTREDLFIQTKFTHLAGQDERLPYDKDASLTDQVLQSFESSLQHLRTTYLDSYLLHGPSRQDTLTQGDMEVWRAMESLHKAGKVRLLGVSNVNPRQLRVIVRDSEIKPAFAQLRTFARVGWNRMHRQVCKESGVLFQAFSLLNANIVQLDHPMVTAILHRTKKTLPQVVFRFALQLGLIPMTGTSNEEHMKQDLECFDFELAQADVETLEKLVG